MADAHLRGQHRGAMQRVGGGGQALHTGPRGILEEEGGLGGLARGRREGGRIAVPDAHRGRDGGGPVQGDGGGAGAHRPGRVSLLPCTSSSGRRFFSSRFPAFSVAYHASVDPSVLILFSEIQCSTCHAFRLHVALVCPPRRPPSCLLPTLHLRGSVLPDRSPGRPWNRPSLRGACLLLLIRFVSGFSCGV